MALATKPKWKADAIVICWNSGADTKLDRAVRTGARLRGDDPYVVRHPEDFVADGDSLPDPRVLAEIESSPPAPLTGRYKIRILEGSMETKGEPRASVQGKPYFDGETLVVEGKDASFLVDKGVAEIIKAVK